MIKANNKSLKQNPLTKIARLNEEFFIKENEIVYFEGTNINLKLVHFKHEYRGHRFEERGDCYQAEIIFTQGTIKDTILLDWWERNELPDEVIKHKNYWFVVINFATSPDRKNRCLKLLLKPANADNSIQV